MRILLLEDEPGLGRAVQEHLTLAGHQVAWARSVADAEEQVSDTDAADAPAVKQAAITLAALVATRDATMRAMSGLG
jgi:DNA-binding response OmpR family regulator